MPYTPDYHSGGEGKGVINGTDLNVTKWSGGETSTDKDVTTTGDFDPIAKLTRGRDKSTKTRYEAKLDCFVDGNNFQLTALRAGTEVLNVFLTTIPGHGVSMPIALVTNVPTESGGVEGITAFSVSIKSQGPYVVS